MRGIFTGTWDLTSAVTTQAARVSESFASVSDSFMCLFPSSAVKTIPISVSSAAPPSWTHGGWGDGMTALSPEELLKMPEYLDSCSDKENQLRPPGGRCSQNPHRKRTTKNFVAHIEDPMMRLRNSFIRCCTGCRGGGSLLAARSHASSES